MVSTLAGSGAFGSTNGIGTNASFYDPTGVAVDASGNVYVTDFDNNQIRKISPAGVVSLFAGSTIFVAGISAPGSNDGTGAMASFSNPWGIAIDASGNSYIGDSGNCIIRKINPGGTVSTIAGNVLGAGSANGMGLKASFYSPSGVAVDLSGNIYVADDGNNQIRKINPDGVVSTLAGSGETGSVNGTGSSASFNSPVGVTVDKAGNIYVADFGNNEIRKVSPAGQVSTFAGNTVHGSADGTGSSASFFEPTGVAVDASGNIYVSDDGNEKIRKISPAGVVSAIAGNGTIGSANGLGSQASFHFPLGIAVDASGNIYVSDAGNEMIRKITFQ